MDSIDWPSGSPETITYKALDIHLSKYQVSFKYVYEELCQMNHRLFVSTVLSSASKTNRAKLQVAIFVLGCCIRTSTGKLHSSVFWLSIEQRISPRMATLFSCTIQLKSANISI